MRLETIRQVEQVKRRHEERAEQLLRARDAALEAALIAADAARETLATWRAEMPARQASIYDAIIGQLIDREGLEGCQAAVAALRAHENVLAAKLAEAEAAARQARDARAEAEAGLADARRAVAKFTDLIAVLQRAEAAEATLRADAELEESAEIRGMAAGLEGGDDEWSEAA